MLKNALMAFGSSFLLFILTVSPAAAADHGPTEGVKSKTAIVLANFGTTVPSAVTAIVNIQDEVQKAFPGVPVKITFTSNIIRAVWRERQAESAKWLNQGIPAEILYVKNIIATVGELMEEGYRSIIVQPTHIFFMEQSHDLAAHVRALAGIRTMKAKWQPFDKIVMGRPALGMPGDRYSYHEDMEKALKTLAADVELARKQGAMLVYMGHGNEHWSTGIYGEAQKKMREMYPDVVTYIGAVEGFPGIDDVARYLSHFESGKIVLKPLMIVAGDHAMNDMASDEPDSWKTILSGKGFSVEPVLEGLGSNDQFAQIFVAHIRDAARDNGIPLE
ncbi:MAG: sirohydrochlorin cobaltochelatase [Desulfobacteraceae bacterium]|jgi:sirohydrochlorin cobaltochelatase|nr:sirohydrochlorin cobaltochelatase [Desulfobacteraceae bacterium]